MNICNTTSALVMRASSVHSSEPEAGVVTTVERVTVDMDGVEAWRLLAFLESFGQLHWQIAEDLRANLTAVFAGRRPT